MEYVGGRKNYRRLGNERKGYTDKAKKEYLDSMVQEHGISKDRTLSFNLHEGKGCWMENHGVQIIGIEDSQGSIQID
jgi:hypothetical protein